jgi:magnesium-transporting ATPase (P-type)
MYVSLRPSKWCQAIFLLEAGDAISADLRLIEASNLAADESTLTGESVAVVDVTAEGCQDIGRAPLAFPLPIA